MRRTRLLVVLPAAGALLFTGLAPAAAGDDYDRHRDDRLAAKVIDIDDEAEANRRGTEVSVTFDYKCWGDEDDLVARVVLRQDGARYSGSSDRDFECDGHEQSKTVELRDSGGRLENDDARVTVRLLDDDGDVLSERTERGVEVEGVRSNRDDRDGRDRDDDDHKRHHDDDR
jgi:hypothetical protein